MKLATILVSMLFAGSVFANGHEATKAPAPGTEMAAAPAADAPVKKEQKKKHNKKDEKKETH